MTSRTSRSFANERVKGAHPFSGATSILWLVCRESSGWRLKPRLGEARSLPPATQLGVRAGGLRAVKRREFIRRGHRAYFNWRLIVSTNCNRRGGFRLINLNVSINYFGNCKLNRSAPVLGRNINLAAQIGSLSVRAGTPALLFHCALLQHDQSFGANGLCARNSIFRLVSQDDGLADHR